MRNSRKMGVARLSGPLIGLNERSEESKPTVGFVANQRPRFLTTPKWLVIFNITISRKIVAQFAPERIVYNATLLYWSTLSPDHEAPFCYSSHPKNGHRWTLDNVQATVGIQWATWFVSTLYQSLKTKEYKSSVTAVGRNFQASSL
jgi:hypothetical protein